MHLTDLKNKKVAVLGLGVEGLSTQHYLEKHGIKTTGLDEKNEKEAFAHLEDFDILFRTPGISPLRPELVKAKEKGIVITSQAQFFLDNCVCQVTGVTGTKGKGTTSSLIFEMLKKQGFDAYLGGNIGRPPMDFLDSLSTHSKVVLELSSFQLMDVLKSPQIAVVLMITQEHLDYHADIAEYVDAKRNILRFQKQADYAVINRDYIASSESDIFTAGKVFQVSIERSCERGCYIKNKAVYVAGFGVEKEIIKTKDVLLPGKHNLENVCAAVMTATLAGVNKDTIVTVLKTFKGLEHRLQLIREVHGVKYYDDSFSTTPETAIAAIEAFEQPEILILGGSSKNSDFSQLGKTIRLAKNIKAIIGIGVEWENIKEQLATTNSHITIIEEAQDMHTVVAAASKIAQPGDVVLLSPACASFGMFKNYKDRGEQFIQEVTTL